MAVQERILNEIKGRMLEDIVLQETQMANPKKEVFVLQFAIGEFDMVVFDPLEGNCQIFEIKHSTEAVKSQYRHLIDSDRCGTFRRFRSNRILKARRKGLRRNSEKKKKTDCNADFSCCDCYFCSDYSRNSWKHCK